MTDTPKHGNNTKRHSNPIVQSLYRIAYSTSFTARPLKKLTDRQQTVFVDTFLAQLQIYADTMFTERKSQKRATHAALAMGDNLTFILEKPSGCDVEVWRDVIESAWSGTLNSVGDYYQVSGNVRYTRAKSESEILVDHLLTEKPHSAWHRRMHIEEYDREECTV